MKDYLVIVDMQNDFIDGSLGSGRAQNIVEKVAAFAKKFRGEILFTMDTHGEDYLDSTEGKNLPVKHCVRGTTGWQLHESLKEVAAGCKIFEKNAFGSRELVDYLADKDKTGCVDSVELVGACTDICVAVNALLIKTFLPDCKVIVDGSLCIGTSRASHRAALTTLKNCQVEILIDGELKPLSF